MPRRPLACLLLAGFALRAEAASLSVNASGTGPYPTIQAAIQAAAPGDTVILQPGTYSGEGNRDIRFAGKPITVRSIAPDTPSVVAQTVVDAQYGGRGFLFAASETSTSILAGITIINGHTGEDGGGIACHGASPVIRQCRVLNCSAGDFWTAGFGGGLSLDNSSAIVSQCVFTGNSAWLGGGVYAGAGMARLSSCVIAANSTFSTSGTADALGGGGGICFVSDATTVIHCTIANNTCVHGRGGLYTFLGPATPVITHCIVWGNAGTQMALSGQAPAVAWSDIQGGFAGIGNINSNPNLTADYHLSRSSPGVDAGDPSYKPGDGERDIDGQPRRMNGRVDLGADEVTLAGDVNMDGRVNIVDLLLLSDCWGTGRGNPRYNAACDLNGNDTIDAADLAILASHWTVANEATPTGDINLDGRVNIIDLLLLGDSWGTSFGHPRYNAAGDLDGNGTIDTADLAILADYWAN